MEFIKSKLNMTLSANEKCLLINDEICSICDIEFIKLIENFHKKKECPNERFHMISISFINRKSLEYYYDKGLLNVCQSDFNRLGEIISKFYWLYSDLKYQFNGNWRITKKLTYDSDNREEFERRKIKVEMEKVLNRIDSLKNEIKELESELKKSEMKYDKIKSVLK